ncbi:MAG: hypothetical protein ACQUHE_17460, partial [Bacteroidia bacterium]
MNSFQLINDLVKLVEEFEHHQNDKNGLSLENFGGFMNARLMSQNTAAERDIRFGKQELEQQKNVAEDILERQEIRSPGSGTIQNLKVHTTGAVIKAGEVLMELVPE